ncbi:MAG: GDSL-type esterase/lipase family protein [Solirubrobacteraceae bacterium]
MTAVLAGCGGGGAAAPRAATAACSAPAWVAAWAADPSDGMNPGIVDQTARTILTANLAGDTVRVHLSNRFGAGPVKFGAASVGLAAGAGPGLVAGSRRPLTFGGAASVTVARGADAVSDPVSLHLDPSSDVAVSVFAAGATGPATEHALGQQTSFFSPPGSGDHTAEDGGGAFTIPTRARYFVSGVDVRATSAVGLVVAMGDSITDGFGGPPDGHDRYPDFLAKRLAGRSLSVANAGISGNHVLSDGPGQAGPSALHRLAADVLGAPGASDVIVLEGVNDIGRQAPADRVIAGLGEIVSRLHTAGLGVQVATLTPFGSAAAPKAPLAAAEASRAQVNRWIRAGAGGADGTADFDAAVRDPVHLSRLAPRYDSGDHLHPNAAGRRALAGAVDVAGLRGASCKAA